MIATIRFYRGTGIGAAIVRGFTRSEIGHVDLLAHDCTLEVRPSTGAHWTTSPQPVGDLMAQAEIFVPDAAARRASEMLDLFIPAKYDWFGVIAAGVPMLAREHATAFFCSEAVATWLDSAGVISAPEPWRMQPVSLFDALSKHPQVIP